MTKGKDIVIKLVNISKRYTLHHEKPTFSERIINGKEKKFWALRKINLTIEKGERLGIIGPNGSGKTTLMKIIAKITHPTSGSIETGKKIVSLIELDSGFVRDFSGYENIFLNGMLIGLSRREIQNNLVSIIEFSGIGRFIHNPFYTYSEGMALRLGLSIVLHSDFNIYLFDENLYVGDKNFQTKYMERIRALYRKGCTFIFSSHWLEFLRENCTKILLLNRGKIKATGSPNNIIRKYINGRY